MARTDTQQSLSRCTNCGFETTTGGEDWETVESPSLGRMTSCPDCGSTNVTLRW